MTTPKPHPALMQQLVGKRRFISEETGMELVRQLQQTPAVTHNYPAVDRSRHKPSVRCPCRPTIREVAWWKLEAEHQPIAARDSGDELSAEDWNDLHRQQSRRHR
jgi:hypothetical protein